MDLILRLNWFLLVLAVNQSVSEHLISIKCTSLFKFVPFEVFQWNYNDQVEELVVRLKGKDLCESFKELLFVFQSNAAESELLSIY